MTTLCILFVVFGALWRRAVGSDKGLPYIRLYPIPFIFLAYLALPWTITAGLFVAYLSLVDGYKDWEDWGYMSMRFTGYAAIACAFWGIDTLYVFFGAVSGFSYPLGAYIKKKYSTRFEYTKYAELLTGALMFGGVFV